MSKVLILTDGKAGHENQSRAFARALGCEPALLPVRFRSPPAKSLSYLLDFFGILTLKVFKDLKGLEGLKGLTGLKAVVGAGSGTFYAAKALARKLGVPCGVVLYPRGYRLAGFDCILAPSFDRPDIAPNVVPVPANLVAADAAFYEAGVKAFRERHTPSGRPAVAVIVGGPNKRATLSADWMRAQLERIFAKYKPAEPNASPPRQAPGARHELWVTTSRRTPPDVEAVVDSFPFDYKLLYSRDRFNPIPAFVSLASAIYVTAESTGMISEACTFGAAEVHALDNLKPGPHKFRRFIDGLAAAGHLGGSRKIDLSGQFARARELLGLTG
ncbi:MAG: mitochondrial fission ELM1 family protein [Kiritimatiellae bacterium]|nr:mitochondrial fission ELM1 family protein [Kiritimatiellia bacterium]